jgi:hypothetical protein
VVGRINVPEQSMHRQILVLTMLGFSVAGSARADPITLNPDMAANIDSSLSQGNNVWGNAFLLAPGFANADQGLIHFDLSHVAHPVARAIMTVYAADLQDPPWSISPNSIYSVFRNTSAWQSTTVTWNSKPGIDPTSVSSASASPHQNGGTPFQWDVTSVVNDWISGRGANFGLTIDGQNGLLPNFDFVTQPILEPFGPTGAVPTLVLETSAVSPTPEPTSLLLAGIGALALVGCRFRRKV